MKVSNKLLTTEITDVFITHDGSCRNLQNHLPSLWFWNCLSMQLDLLLSVSDQLYTHYDRTGLFNKYLAAILQYYWFPLYSQNLFYAAEDTPLRRHLE